jgi:hypothetical protein
MSETSPVDESAIVPDASATVPSENSLQSIKELLNNCKKQNLIYFGSNANLYNKLHPFLFGVEELLSIVVFIHYIAIYYTEVSTLSALSGSPDICKTSVKEDVIFKILVLLGGVLTIVRILLNHMTKSTISDTIFSSVMFCLSIYILIMVISRRNKLNEVATCNASNPAVVEAKSQNSQQLLFSIVGVVVSLGYLVLSILNVTGIREPIYMSDYSKYVDDMTDEIIRTQ